MSEAAEQAKEIQSLMIALVSSEAALQAAANAAREYAVEVDAGTRAVSESARANETASRAVEDSERAKRAAVDKTAASLEKLKGLAMGALGGEETVEKYTKARDAMKLAGDASLSGGQRAVAMASGLKFAASTAMALGGAVSQAAGDVVRFVQEARQAEAALAATDQRVHALGGSLAAMKSATAGAVDTQVAFNLSLSLAEQGLRASEAQQAGLARAIREHANARQVSQEQASSTIQRALSGDAAAATTLGISLSSATTTAERYTLVLRQLEQQQRGNGVASETAAEAARRSEQEMARASQTVQAAAGGWVRALPLVRLYAAGLNEVTRRQEESSVATEEAGQALARQTVEQERSARAAERLQSLERARREDAQRATALQQSSAVQELQQLDEWVVGLGEVISAQDQLNQARAAAREFSARDGDTEAQTNERRVQTANNLTAALRRKNAEDTRQDGLRTAEAHIGLAAHQARQLGLHVDARIRSITPAQRLVQLQRELATFAAREGESLEQSNARRQQALQEATAAAQQAQQAAREARDRARERRSLLFEGFAEHRRMSAVERERGETQVEYMRRRIGLQRELGQLISHEVSLNETLDALAGRNTKEAENEEHRLNLQRERNETTREAEAQRRTNLIEQDRERAQRYSEQQQQVKDANDVAVQMRSAYGLAEDASRTATQRMVEGAKSATDGLGELGKGAIEAVIAASQEGKDAGAAIAAYVDQWATQKAIQWGMQSAESFAGAGLAYFLRPDAVPGLLAAGATYAGLALAAGGVAAAIPNAPAASAGSAGGTGGGLGLAASSRAEAAGPATANIVFNINGVMANEQTQEVLARGIRDAADRGLLNLGAR